MTSLIIRKPINISFYKISEYFDVCEINGSKYAFFSKPITSPQNLSIDLSDYNVIFLAPLQAEKDISIKAISVIALTSLNAEKGGIKINASNLFISLGATIKSYSDCRISAKKGSFFLNILEKNLRMIRNTFNDGISKEQESTVVQAIKDTFYAIEDSSQEDNKNIEPFNIFLS